MNVLHNVKNNTLSEIDVTAPTIADVRNLATRLQQWLIRTPVIRCRNLEYTIGDGLEIVGKMEFLQRTGTFKPRGALSVVLGLDDAQLAAGITAVSAGNHAIATAFAGKTTGTSAKVVMIRSASQIRIDACESYGAEVVLADDVHHAFDEVEKIRRQEGRFFVHPFDGAQVTTGTATIGLEICEQIEQFDAVIVPVGGGGLCAGISSFVKQINPECIVIGVEPYGADSMHRSFTSGKAEKIDAVKTIADSLGAPFATHYSYEMCRQYVNEVVRVSDDEIRAAMSVLFSEMKMAVEPACAASTAALAGPLRGRLSGKRVVLLFCGSNIDWKEFQEHAGTGLC